MMSKYISVLTAFTLLFSFSLPAQKLKVETFEDAFEGTTTHTMTGNRVKIDGAGTKTAVKGVLSMLSGGFQLSITRLDMNLERHEEQGQEPELSVIVSVEIKDDSPFYIDQGESLIFLADGQRIGLSTSGEFNTQRGYEEYSTNARYAITPEQITQITQADTVMFRLINGGFLDRAETARDKKKQCDGGGIR